MGDEWFFIRTYVCVKKTTNTNFEKKKDLHIYLVVTECMCLCENSVCIENKNISRWKIYLNNS